jgi:hypothetical protein
LTAGLLCNGDGAGVSPVWAKADCKVIMRVIRETHANVFVTATSRMTTIGRMDVRPWLQLRERRGVHPRRTIEGASTRTLDSVSQFPEP